MFFTITSVEHVLLDLDEFLPDEIGLFNSVKQVLANYKVVCVTAHRDDRSAMLDTSGMKVVAAGNTTEAIVFQNVLRRALREIGGVPSNSVYVAAGAMHLRNACELLLGTAIVRRKNMNSQELIKIFESFPDFLAPDADCLRNALIGNHIGYGAEYFSTPADCRIFQPAKPLVSYEQVPNEEHPDCPMVIAGRYFSEKDPRHGLHPLSIRLVGAKNKPEIQAKLFGWGLALAIRWAGSKGVDFVGCVPPRPTDRNRIAAFLEGIPSSDSENIKVRLRPELLTCIRPYPKLKMLPAHQRRDAVRGAFALTESVQGKTIVIIDDIRTTGSTLNEAISVLRAGGAQKIVPLVIGYHPFANNTLALTDDEQLHCSLCQGVMVPRVNGTDGQPFYGCSGWTAGNNRHTTHKLGTAIRQKLKIMEPKLMGYDDELNSDGIDF